MIIETGPFGLRVWQALGASIREIEETVALWRSWGIQCRAEWKR